MAPDGWQRLCGIATGRSEMVRGTVVLKVVLDSDADHPILPKYMLCAPTSLSSRAAAVL